MNDYYRGRVAWVMGGSQGIGLAVARSLAERGARLTLCARNEELLEQQAAELGASWKAFDVADPAAVEGAVRALLYEQGAPALVFNCAGLALPGYLHELSWHDIERMTNVNYLGTAAVCRAVLPALLAVKTGHIVNTSSLGGFMGLFGYTAYCASKYAVTGFSEALRREVRGQGIRVSVLCPPNTRTPGLMAENLRKPPEVLATEEKIQVLEPEQVARYMLGVLPTDPFLIIPSFDGRLAQKLARFAPWLLDVFLKRPK